MDYSTLLHQNSTSLCTKVGCYANAVNTDIDYSELFSRNFSDEIDSPTTAAAARRRGIYEFSKTEVISRN